MAVLNPRALLIQAEPSMMNPDQRTALKDQLKKYKISFDIRVGANLNFKDLLASTVYFWELSPGSTKIFKSQYAEIERALKGVNLAGRFLMVLANTDLAPDVDKLKSIFKDTSVNFIEPPFDLEKGRDISRLDNWLKEDHGLFV